MPVFGFGYWHTGVGNTGIITNENPTGLSLIPSTYLDHDASQASYGHAQSVGNRSASIVVTSSTGMFQSPADPATIPHLVNGNLTETGTPYFLTVAALGKWIQYDFGSAVLITEMTWRQSTGASHGSFRMEGSDDAVSWTTVSASFSIGAMNTVQPMTPAKAYRYYRMIGESGTLSQAPWLYEVEFKIAPLTASLTRALPAPVYALKAMPDNGADIYTIVATDPEGQALTYSEVLDLSDVFAVSGDRLLWQPGTSYQMTHDPGAFTSGAGGWGGYTLRQLIPSSEILLSGSSVRVTFRVPSTGPMDLTEAWIGHKAASGSAWDFASTPTRLTFGGNNGINVGASTDFTSDAVAFALDENRDLLVSVYCAGASSITRDNTVSNSGYTFFYKAAVNEAALVAPSATNMNTGVNQRAMVRSIEALLPNRPATPSFDVTLRATDPAGGAVEGTFTIRRPTRYHRAYLTADGTSTNYSAGTNAVIWNAAVGTELGAWSLVRGTRLTVPPGVTRIKLRSCVTLNGIDTNNTEHAVRFGKNGSATFDGNGYASAKWVTGDFSPQVLWCETRELAVVAGDYFELFPLITDTAVALEGTNQDSWMEMEILG